MIMSVFYLVSLFSEFWFIDVDKKMQTRKMLNSKSEKTFKVLL